MVKFLEKAPNSRFNETPEKIIQSFRNVENLLPKNINDEVNLEDLDVENSLKMALVRLI